MLKQKTKDIEVGGKSYRLTKLDARTGSYVAAKLALLAAPLIKDKAEFTQEALTPLVSSLSRKDFNELQAILLQCVHKLNDVNGVLLPEPILTGKEEFVDPELAYDVPSVIALTVHAAMFNVGGFFEEAGLSIPAK